MDCTYCRSRGFRDHDEWIDHFISEHTYPVTAPDLDAHLARVTDDDGLEADGVLFVLEHVVAENFPPGSRTSYMDVRLDENSAMNLSEWLNAQTLGLAEQITAQAVADEWGNFGKIRVTIRVEPLFTNEKGTQGV